MSVDEPRHGEGWDDLVESEDALYEAFETTEDGELDYESYGFDSAGEMAGYVQENGFDLVDDDYDRMKREMQNGRWEIPMQDAVFKTAGTIFDVEKRSTQQRDADTAYTATFCAYDSDQRSEEAHFTFEVSWTDTPPDEVTYQELFSSEFEE